MNTQQAQALEALRVGIRNLHSPLEGLIAKFREVIAQTEQKQDIGALRRSAAYWRQVAYVDSLVRVRLFIEQNFNYVESMGLLAVTRYLFELTVWLKLLLEKDKPYGLVYYRMLIENQLDYYKELQEHLTREVSLFRAMSGKERKLIDEKLQEAQRIADSQARTNALSHLHENVTQKIDDEAARRFSLYGASARTNGYDFQAHLIETKIIPGVSNSIVAIEQELRLLDRDLPSDVKSLVPNRWKWVWRDQATPAGMKDEFDFIYSYTSRLLHAKPVSLTTDQKNLEPDEVRMFLRYIDVRLLDIIDWANSLLAEDAVVG